MSRFYVSAHGSRGEATRQGTANSGIDAHPRGWSLGVSVHGHAVHGNDDKGRFGDTGRDAFDASITGGSNGGPFPAHVLHVEQLEGGEVLLTLYDPSTPMRDELGRWVRTSQGWEPFIHEAADA